MQTKFTMTDNQDSLKMNVDCWLQILSEIPPNERTNYRSVCMQWCQLIDYLDFNQKGIEFCIENSCSQSNSNSLVQKHADPGTSAAISCQPTALFMGNNNTNNNNNNFRCNQHHISYDLFCKIFSHYPNLRRLTFSNFNQWNDHYLIRLVERCPKLRNIALYSCHLFGRNYFNDFGFQNVTQIGWQRLVFNYGKQLTTLVLEDCDLENHHLSLIVQSFPSLKHLNIANNTEITNFVPLCELSSEIQVLKIGPKLSKINRRSQRYYFNHEMPIEEIISGNGRNLRVLQLQGYLSSKLWMLCNLPFLEHLIINYITFSLVEDIFNQEINSLIYSLKHITNLKQLSLRQFNQVNSSDIQFLRQHSLSLSSNINRQSVKFSGQLNLERFSLHSKDPLIVIQQFQLINFILASSPKLTSFALSSSTFDPSLHYNLNQTILVLLTKHGHKLKEIKLENMFSTDFYFYLAQTILKCSSLTKFIIDDCDMETFLDCIDEQQELLEKEFYPGHRKPLTITFSISNLKMLDIYREQLSRCQYSYLDRFVHVNFGLNKCLGDGGCRSDGTAVQDDDQDSRDLYSSYHNSEDNDLTDLCQLIDSSFDLIGNVVDVIAICANYFGIIVTYWMILRPSRFIGYCKSILRLGR